MKHLLTCATLAAAAWAQDTPAVDFPDSTNGTQAGVGLVAGYQFTVKERINVTRLGAVLSGSPSKPPFGALPASMEVGIWNAAKQLIASGTVTSAQPRTGSFNYAVVQPVTLVPGQTYTIAGRLTAGQAVLSNVLGVTPGAAVTIGSPRSAIANALTLPEGDLISIRNSYFGPTFSYALAPTGGRPNPPAVVRPGQSAPGSSVVTFEWTAVTGASGYEFKLYDTTTGELALKLAPDASQTGAVYTLRGGSYRLELKACDAAGCSGVSTNNFSVTPGPVPTTAPTGVTCSVGNDNSQNRMTCNWPAVTGADFYFVNVVQPGAGPGGGALTVAGGQAGTNSTNMLVPNGSLLVVVRACNGNGCGPQSTAATLNATHGNPKAPVLGEPFTGSSVDGGANAASVTFTWSRMPGDNGSNFRYRLYVQDFSRNKSALDLVTSNNFAVGYFNPATRYDAVVLATPVAGGATVQGPPAGFVTRGRNPLSPSFTEPAVGSEVARDAAGKVRLGWTPVPNADGSTTGRVYQYVVTGPTNASGATTDTSVDLTLNPGTYSGLVRVCASGTSCAPSSNAGWSPWSNAQGGSGPTSFTVK